MRAKVKTLNAEISKLADYRQTFFADIGGRFP